MKTKTLTQGVGFTLIGIFILFSSGKAAYGGVDVHIGVGIPILPAVVIPAPPAVVMIPNTPVYYAPDAGIDLFFYSGAWYRRHNDYWFRAPYYNGPWGYVQPPQVPPVFVQLPAHYDRIPPGQARIPYGQLKKHWNKEHAGHHKSYHR